MLDFRFTVFFGWKAMKKRRKAAAPPPMPVESYRVVYRLYDSGRLQSFPDAMGGDSVECFRCGKDHELISAVAITAKKKDRMFLVYKCRGLWEIGAIEGKLIAGRLPEREVGQER